MMSSRVRRRRGGGSDDVKVADILIARAVRGLGARRRGCAARGRRRVLCGGRPGVRGRAGRARRRARRSARRRAGRVGIVREVTQLVGVAVVQRVDRIRRGDAVRSRSCRWAAGRPGAAGGRQVEGRTMVGERGADEAAGGGGDRLGTVMGELAQRVVLAGGEADGNAAYALLAGEQPFASGGRGGPWGPPVCPADLQPCVPALPGECRTAPWGARRAVCGTPRPGTRSRSARRGWVRPLDCSRSLRLPSRSNAPGESSESMTSLGCGPSRSFDRQGLVAGARP
jgi:hypothetical protein